jgi:hypothetical protein
VKSILSNIPPTSTRNVLVEGFDYDSEVDGTLESSEVNIASGFEENVLSKPSSFGIWVEVVAVALFAFGLSGVLSNVSAIWENLGIVASLFFTTIGLSVAFTSGHRDGDPSQLRMITALVIGVASIGFAALSLVQGGFTVGLWPTAFAIACSIAFWSLLRLTGETTFRCLSLGMVFVGPFLLVTGSFADSLYASVDRMSIWFASAFFDMASISYGVRDLGFQFVGGEITSMASSNTFTGIAGPLGLALATSVILRQSLILTAVSGLTAAAWWSIFRGFVCLSAAQNSQISGTWDSVAMPLYSWLLLMFVIVGTQVFLSSFFAPLPLDERPIDHPILPQIYNFLVSFPQTGPKHAALFAPYRRQELESDGRLQDGNYINSDDSSSGTQIDHEVHQRNDSHQHAEDWEPTVKSTSRFDRKNPIE